jgi:hypothetical protein
MVSEATHWSNACRRAAWAAFALIVLVLGSAGQACAAVDDVAFVKAKAAFDALDLTTRKSIQRDLIWVASYDGLVDGNFGHGTFDAIRAYQRASGAADDGVLNPVSSKALAAAGAAKRQEAQFVRVYEEAIGAILAVPRRTLSKWTPGRPDPIASSPDDSVQVRFFRRSGASVSFASFFATELKETPRRHVRYRFPRRDAEPVEAITVAGDDSGKQFYTRAIGRARDVRGFTVTWDAKLNPDFDQMVVAMVADFDGFPTEAAIAELRKPATPLPDAAKEPAPRPAAAGVVIGTGFFVGRDGRAIVPRPVVGCRAPVAQGFGPLITGAGAAPGLFIAARVEGARTGLSALSAKKPSVAGSFYVVSGAGSYPGLMGEGARVSGAMLVAGSSASSYQILSALPPGAQGAPVVDARGHLIGVVAEAQSSLSGSSDWRPGPYSVEPVAAVARGLDLGGAVADAGDAQDGLPLDEIAKSVFTVVCQG